MGTSEKFCLRWNDFESNISVAFRELREEKDFFDVTLACDDSQIQAHKVILTACSPFFRNVLRRNPHQHPLLYLKGVKYKDILSVLNFMYMGEVNVAQEELNSFLSVAEDLRVKGLTQNNSSETPSTRELPKPEPNKHIIRQRDPPERDPIAPPPKRPRPPPQVSAPIQSFRADDDDIQEVVPVKSEPRDPVPMALPVAPVEPQVYHQHQQQQDQIAEEQGQGTVALDESYGDESYDYGQYGEGYEDGGGMMDTSGMAMGGADGNKDLGNIEAKMMRVSKGWKCLDCEYEHIRKDLMFSHIQANHVDFPGYSCNICGKFSKTWVALNKHRTRNHKNQDPA
eukprot:GFUD01023367.1.p1 GENE.GFUD01023367.1~~GFUD01023367.1.p1  ORF type:complete len:340 (+),score=66.68 GFUD01023367.1:27-1046(+)